jgi:hypothetical protein
MNGLSGIDMQIRKIILTGALGGLILLVVTIISGAVAGVILPYNIFDIPGMRPVTDPVAVLFFFYPFVVAVAAAILYDIIDPVLPGTTVRKGITYGLLLVVIVTIPNQYIIWSSMYYPMGFYLSNILSGIIGFPFFGILCARIWGQGGLQRLKREAAGI